MGNLTCSIAWASWRIQNRNHFLMPIDRSRLSTTFNKLSFNSETFGQALCYSGPLVPAHSLHRQINYISDCTYIINRIPQQSPILPTRKCSHLCLITTPSPPPPLQLHHLSTHPRHTLPPLSTLHLSPNPTPPPQLISPTLTTPSPPKEPNFHNQKPPSPPTFYTIHQLRSPALSFR